MDAFPIRQQQNNCQACAVRNRAICGDLEPGELDLLNRIGRQRRLEAGEALLWEGDDAVVVANVIDGVIKLSTRTADGREQILGLAYGSDFIGRPFGREMPYDAVALTDSFVCVFGRSDFDRFAREHPRLEHKLLERTLAELDRTRRWILLLGRMSAEQKLAAFLLELSQRLAPTACDVNHEASDALTLPLSRQQIADVLGLTIETVSRQFTRFRSDGLIDTPSRRVVHILDRAALVDLAG